jgi:peptidoglycan/xylan/chitin deacetylase (PgdA/CDA1 family)
LQAAGIPATAFISSGFVDTERRFQHDTDKYPFHHQNCDRKDIQSWLAASFEIGAHTVNHIDLGKCGTNVARHEIFGSLTDLAAIGGKPVSLFSFPFGGPGNITPESVELVREAGCSALFSAHGGIVGKQTDIWDVPRFGVSSVHKPLWLMMEIEGFSLAAVGSRLKRRVPENGAHRSFS